MEDKRLTVEEVGKLANPDCKKKGCYGRGVIGQNVVTGMWEVCECVKKAIRLGKTEALNG